MSHLILSNSERTWTMNVMSFNTALNAQISGAGVKKMMHWYPIKVTQPDISFNVQFSSVIEFETFQKWVRSAHQLALEKAETVTMSWPERNMDNFTGFIGNFVGGGERYVQAPQGSFQVQLVDSFVSKRTELATHTLLWRAIFGEGLENGVLGLPTQSEINQFPDLGGLPSGSVSGRPLPQANPSQPGFGPSGITTGG